MGAVGSLYRMLPAASVTVPAHMEAQLLCPHCHFSRNNWLSDIWVLIGWCRLGSMVLSCSFHSQTCMTWQTCMAIQFHMIKLPQCLSIKPLPLLFLHTPAKRQGASADELHVTAAKTPTFCWTQDPVKTQARPNQPWTRCSLFKTAPRQPWPVFKVAHF